MKNTTLSNAKMDTNKNNEYLFMKDVHIIVDSGTSVNLMPRADYLTLKRFIEE